MNLLSALRNRTTPGESRFGWNDYLELINSMKFGGNLYGVQTTMGSSKGEDIPTHFAGYVEAAYKRNGVVFACILARMMLFSEARFAFRRFDENGPGRLFGHGSPALAAIERPGLNVSTGELLGRMEQDASLAGNGYVARRRAGLVRLRPDWVTIISGTEEPDAADATPDEIDSDVIGYLYKPGGQSSNRKARLLLPDEVGHFSPIPDPTAHHRGMSWMTPILDEVQADGAATTHKLKFFENGATPNLTVSLAKEVGKTAFDEFVEAMDEQHKGLSNAYKTLYLGGGADVKVVGNSFEQMSFKTTQGAGETRICAAANVPPIIVGLSEGLEASTYSNYGQARRKFGDHFAHPQWRMAAAALETVVDVPPGASLAHDVRGVAFLKEDEKDAATIAQTNAQAIRTLTDAGYDADTVIEAVTTGDLSRLKGKHSGLFSVQLQPPGTGDSPASAPAA